MKTHTTQSIVYYFGPQTEHYPLRRALTFINIFNKTKALLVLTTQAQQHIFQNEQIPVQVWDEQSTTTLQRMQPDCFVYDGSDLTDRTLTQLRTFIPRIVQFDDQDAHPFSTDLLVQLFSTREKEDPNIALVGAKMFVVDDTLAAAKEHRLAHHEEKAVLRLVVHFSGHDPSQLTYRVLRHLIHLQIPLDVTIVIGTNYAGDVSTLRMMTLQRNQTRLVQTDDALDVLRDADLIICAAGYTTFEVATLGIPCIVLAMNEAEMAYPFATDTHGFIHLGLGRKMKRSHLFNAIMELVLHDALREKYVTKQLSFAPVGRLSISHAIEQLFHTSPSIENQTTNML